MLEAIVGSISAERVLLFLAARDEGYGAEIAKLFSTDLSPIQKQLERMERDGLLISRKVGRTRLYSFNPRNPFVPELQRCSKRHYHSALMTYNSRCYSSAVARAKRASPYECHQRFVSA